MPAYSRPLVPKRCDWPSCLRKPTREVFNARNAAMGKYCDAHAKMTVEACNKNLPQEQRGR